jgi:hypothetical protein
MPSSASFTLESGKKQVELVVLPGAAAGAHTGPACLGVLERFPVGYFSCVPVPQRWADTPGACGADLRDAVTKQPLPGRVLSFVGYCIGSVTTNALGAATMTGRAGYQYCGSATCTYGGGYTVRFAGDDEYFSS